jgi:putative copper export protein
MVLWLNEVMMVLGGHSVFSLGGAALIPRVLSHSQFGNIWCARLGVLIVLLAILTLRRGQETDRQAVLDGLAFALAVTALGLLAWTGHTAATAGPLRALHRAADLTHLAAVALWLGGLLPFGFSLSVAVHSLELSLLPVLQSATKRFSRIALWSVLGLAASGALKCWIMVGSANAVITTDYGTLVLSKLGLIVPILGLAGFNRWILTPRLLAFGPEEGSQPATQRTLRLFVWSVVGEIGIGVGILILAGILGVTPPPH